MSWTALDSVGQPDPNVARDSGYSFIAAYVGTQYQRYGTTRGYIDRVLGAGLGFWPIFEEWASQFLSGYDVAVQMMGRMRAGWNSLGLPNDGSCCPAIALVDPNPGAVEGNEGALVAFAKGVDDSCWLPSWAGYGSKYGLDVVRGHVWKMQWRWGVGTWGFGERGDGSLPNNVDADMIQHGNKHAQLPGCDENTVFTEWVGQLGGPVTPTPTPQRPKENDLYIVRNRDTGQRTLYTALGATPNIDEGFSNELQFAGVPYFDVPGGVADSLGIIHFGHRRDLIQGVDDTISDEGGGGGGPVDLASVPRDQWAAETNRRLDSDALDVDPEAGSNVHVV
jgi:hypothetical protein